jgi:hypothetical protein
MNNFGTKEKVIASILSNNPVLKDFIKKFYQRVNYFFNKKGYVLKSDFKVYEVDYSDSESFFGYYDKSPENQDGSKLIYFRTNYNTKKLPSQGHCIEVVLKCLETNTFVVVDKTYAYNWQQGAKMMWLSNDKFIYNVFSETEEIYKSKIYDTENKTYHNIDFPIYDCFNEDLAYTLNYERLMDLRPDYGYRNILPNIDYSDYSNDGIYKLSLKNNTKELIISIDQLMDLKQVISMLGAKHKVNHIMVSPKGTKLMFMHRWMSKSGKRYDRLLVSNYNGTELKIISDNEMVSHCCWQDENTIIGFLRNNDKDGYYKINLMNNKITELPRELASFGDGHPTIINNKMLLDTYPDRSRMKGLYVYNFDKNKMNIIAEFFESLEYYNETRCDLHPRFSKDNSAIYVDSVHSGKRKLFKIDLS